MQNWFKKAKPARSIVPISRFLSSTVFALKHHGSYGCLFALDGIDDEGLTDEVLSDVITRLHGAWQGLPADARLYQYVRIRQGYVSQILRTRPSSMRLQRTWSHRSIGASLRAADSFFRSRARYRMPSLSHSIGHGPTFAVSRPRLALAAGCSQA